MKRNHYFLFFLQWEQNVKKFTIVGPKIPPNTPPLIPPTNLSKIPPLIKFNPINRPTMAQPN